MFRSSRARLIAVPAAILMAVTGLSVAGVAEDLPRGLANGPAFEIDGDVLAAGTTGSLDWDSVVTAVRNADGTCTQTGELTFGTPGHKGVGALVCDGSVGGFADQNVFGSGGDKEEEATDPVQWTIQPSPPSAPKKADLSEVYVYGSVGDSSFDDDPGPELADDLFLAFDMTRLDVNGDTHVDFEFNQKPMTAAGAENCPQPAGTHCQDRVDGDLILAVDLDSATATPATRVFRFRDQLASGETCASVQGTPATGCYVEVPAPTSPSGDPSVRAVLNTAEIPAPPWGTVGCEPVTGDKKPGCRPRTRIPAGGNLEVYLDLSAFLPHNLDLCPGILQATVKTRSSSSISASLTDIAGPVTLRTAVCNSVLIATVDGKGRPVAGAGVQFDPDPFTGVEGSTRTVVDGTDDDHAGGANGYLCVDNVRFGEYRLIETLVPDGYFGDPLTQSSVVVSPSSCAARVGAGGLPPAGAAAADATFVDPQGAFLLRKVDDRGALLGGAGFTISPDPRTHAAGSSLVVTDSDGDGLVCVDDVIVDAAARDASQPTAYTVAESKAPKNYTLDPTPQTVLVAEPGACAKVTPATPTATFVNVRGKGGK